MIHQSVEDGLESIKSDVSNLNQSQLAQRQLQQNGHGGRGHSGHFQPLSDAWTDYSESEAEPDDGSAGPGLRNGFRHPYHQRHHSSHTNLPDSQSSSTSNLSQAYDRSLTRWTHQSQMSLVYQSNPQLADVAEEEELTASIVDQYRDRFTLYKVVVQYGNRTWFVLRRYSDFALLNSKLQKQFPLYHFELPQRRIDRSKFNHAFIDDRQNALDGYLKNILVHCEFANCLHVKRFLKLDDPPRLQEDPESLRTFCKELQRQNNNLQIQLQSARVEIIALRGGKIPQGPQMKESPYAGVPKSTEQQLKAYQDALNRANEDERKAVQEREDLKRDIKAEADAVKETSEQLLKRKEAVIEEQMENFDKLLPNLDEKFSAICKEVPQEGESAMAAKIDDLNQAIQEWEKSLRNHHHTIVEMFQKEITDLKFSIAKKDKVITAKEGEIQQQREEKHQNKLWFNHGLNQKKDRIKNLDEQLKALEKTCLYAEEQYFYALFVGAKLSTSLVRHRRPSLNEFHPQELYEKVQKESVPIKHWASWIAKEMKL